MPLSKAKLKPWGPKPLRELTDQIEKEINERSPIPGLGIYINETPNGRQISTHPSAGAQTQQAGSSNDLPFTLSLAPREDNPALYAVGILDGQVNDEWPSVGVIQMGQTGGAGFGTLNIANVENSNIFVRVMFNAATNEIVRLDIFERPNETFPINRITFGDPVPGACDSIDSPDTAPPEGYGALHIAFGFTYVSAGIPIVFQSRAGHIHFVFVYGSRNGLPALRAAPYTDWIEVPLE